MKNNNKIITRQENYILRYCQQIKKRILKKELLQYSDGFFTLADFEFTLDVENYDCHKCQEKNS